MSNTTTTNTTTNATASATPATELPPPPRGNPTLVALGVGIGIGGAIVLLGVGLLFFWYKRRKIDLSGSLSQGLKAEPSGGSPLKSQQNVPAPTDHMVAMLPKPTHVSPSPSPGMVLGFSKTTFTYEELAQATEGFSNANLLGQGGFGYVHKGILPNGKEVAVKQLKVGSGQGEREFQAEVEIISRVHHRHLVSLVGYCISGAQRMLVYEFVPNNTLQFHLHGKGRQPLSWANRMKIAIGSARGLTYLHEDCQPKIIHRDIKAANILLDYNFEAKVADFGLARLNLEAGTHISTRIMGTFGYLAPEYALSGKLTDKSDVFSFGVMLLELITGKRPIDKAQFVDDDNIVDWARPLLRQALEGGNFDIIVDPRLEKDYDSNEMTRMVACAAVCVRHFSRRRPRMSQVVRALEGNMPLDDLNDGMTPGESSFYESHESSDYDNSISNSNSNYKDDLKKFKRLALESQTHNNCESSGPTSDNDLRQSVSSSEVLQTTREKS